MCRKHTRSTQAARQENARSTPGACQKHARSMHARSMPPARYTPQARNEQVSKSSGRRHAAQHAGQWQNEHAPAKRTQEAARSMLPARCQTRQKHAMSTSMRRHAAKLKNARRSTQQKVSRIFRICSAYIPHIFRISARPYVAQGPSRTARRAARRTQEARHEHLRRMPLECHGAPEACQKCHKKHARSTQAACRENPASHEKANRF